MAEWWENDPVVQEAQPQDWYLSDPVADEVAATAAASVEPQGLGTLGTAADVLASGAAGVARGTAGLVGLPGTVGDYIRSGIGGLMSGGYRLATGSAPDPYSESGVERFFAGPTPEVAEALGLNQPHPLSAEAISGYMSTATGGATDYQPQTTAGDYARTIGEFLPGGVALRGAQTIGQGLAYGTALPAIASETAGQMTEGTVFEPF